MDNSFIFRKTGGSYHLRSTETIKTTATESKTARLTGTALLAAMVILFDYTLKYSGLKIPFPWMPYIKFDFTGVPILLSYFLYGLPSAATTSLVALLGIFMRNPEIIGASMKGIAEFTTVLGVAWGVKLMRNRGFSNSVTRGTSIAAGLILRILIMSVWNLLILPNYYGYDYGYVVGILPLLGLFNAMQGGISAVLGYTLFEAYTRRFSVAPSTR